MFSCFRHCLLSLFFIIWHKSCYRCRGFLTNGFRMGIIELEEMEFYAFHGCYKEEQTVGNKFIVNLTMTADCSLAAATDDVSNAANYLAAYQVVKEQMAVKSHLLENVAERILQALPAKVPTATSARVKISKVNPPLGGKVGRASVTMERVFS